MECTLENNQEILEGPCVTVTEKEWNSSIQKMSETKTSNFCGTPYNIIVSTMTQKKIKWSVHFETRVKRYRNLVKQLHQASGAKLLRKSSKNYLKMCFTLRNNKNGSSMTKKETAKRW